MPLYHQHEWASTQNSYRCMSCSAEVPDRALYLRDLYEPVGGTYEAVGATYDHLTARQTLTVSHQDQPAAWVDQVYYSLGGIGIPLT